MHCSHLASLTTVTTSGCGGSGGNRATAIQISKRRNEMSELAHPHYHIANATNLFYACSSPLNVTISRPHIRRLATVFRPSLLVHFASFSIRIFNGWACQRRSIETILWQYVTDWHRTANAICSFNIRMTSCPLSFNEEL